MTKVQIQAHQNGQCIYNAEQSQDQAFPIRQIMQAARWSPCTMLVTIPEEPHTEPVSASFDLTPDGHDLIWVDAEHLGERHLMITDGTVHDLQYTFWGADGWPLATRVNLDLTDYLDCRIISASSRKVAITSPANTQTVWLSEIGRDALMRISICRFNGLLVAIKDDQIVGVDTAADLSLEARYVGAEFANAVLE